MWEVLANHTLSQLPIVNSLKLVLMFIVYLKIKLQFGNQGLNYEFRLQHKSLGTKELKFLDGHIGLEGKEKI